jgi:threonine dehydrogenase-like Zn-dependent dehydrogenase
MGADDFTTSGAGGAADAARAFSGREGVDLVIETAGTGVAVEQALELAHPGGRVVLTGLPHEASTVNFFGVVRRELRIIGSMIYQEEFPEAIRLLSSGVVTVDRLVTHRFPLARIQEAFAAHRSPEAIKVTVVT